ncbi:MAG: hypothetical protein R3264_22860, partial [Anaerolineae bacterium]|nr:hypothetical protein [Anaerolineae bacterium]
MLLAGLAGLLSLVCVVSVQPKPSTQAVMMATPAPTASPVEPERVSVSSPIPTPTLTATPAVINTPTDIPPDTGWQSIRPGLERRIIPWIDEEGKLLEQFYVLRIDPALHRFDVAFRAKNPLTLTDWLAETGALLVINGGYFSEDNEIYTPNGLAIIEGQRIGTSYGDFAGMLAISEAGPSVRWLREHPYTPDEPLAAALQSFPLLVRPGGILGFPAENEDG